MRAHVRILLLTLCCAVAIGACGSSHSSTAGTQTAETQASSAVAGNQLSRLTAPLPADAGRLPVPSTTAAVERKYLTALFDDAQATWHRDFDAVGLPYTPAHLVVFWSQTESPCGKTQDSGPFYCPGDRTVYLDLRFFALLVNKFGLNRVAQAYLVGHEIAHHVQKLLGIAHQVDLANQTDPAGRNARSVLVELQADCLAGVWGRSAYPRAGVTTSDLNDATRAARVIGDDYDAHATGAVVDSSLWTHGSSKQREFWLRKGFEGGRPVDCDTFAAGAGP